MAPNSAEHYALWTPARRRPVERDANTKISQASDIRGWASTIGKSRSGLRAEIASLPTVPLSEAKDMVLKSNGPDSGVLKK